MTYIGAPYIYYGDEVGMWGANDPCCRKPMLWDEYNYDDEKVNPDQSIKNKIDKNFVNKELFEFHKKLIKIRNDNKVLQLGKFRTLKTDDKNEVFIYTRELDDKQIIVLINKSKNPVEII